MLNRGLTNQSLLSGSYGSDIDSMDNILDAALVLQETGGTLTADGNEQVLYIANTPMGVFEPRIVFVNLDNMGAADTTVFRVYYRLADGGALLQFDYASYTGADGGLANGNKVIGIPLQPCRHGVEVTLQQTAGVNRAYLWSVVEER